MTNDPNMPENNDPSIPASPSDIEPIKLEDEMQRSYLDYAMSVIVSRALPDVRDGLKPVHRRILYAMKEGGYDWNRAYRKSAKAVGDVMGNYHPHGDAAIYMTLVRMAQPFSMSVQLIDGQGNFGSIDDDPPAAMRYTESRLTRIASQMLEDIDKTTVDFQPNYDESTTEPQVLPAQFPNFLVNGAGGIAVGMATNVPPHNLSEAIDACIAYAQNREIAIDELMEIIPGPDFPTGGSILGRSGIHNAYHTGRGSVVMRAKAEIVARGNDREQIIFTEMPYQVNKAKVVTNISQLAKDKVIEGISEVRDESDREGIRLAVDVKRDHQADVVLNQLWRHTQLQTSFGCNMLAIDGGRPEMLNLQRIIQAFVNFREEVITRRTAHELEEARRRSHILVGLAVAVANIDLVIDLIRRAPDPATAKAQLMERKWNATDVAEYIKLIDDPEHALEKDGASYYLSERQAQGILALQLSRLTGLERDKIGEELKDLSVKIEEFLDILAKAERVVAIMVEELKTVKEAYGHPRRTVIEDFEGDINIEELIPREEMVVTVSHGGYVKRVPLETYRAQRRGGKGRTGMSTKDEDFVTELMVCNTHTPVLFFSTDGMAYKMKVFRLPAGTPQSRGKAMVNVLPLAADQSISAFLPLPEDEEEAAELDVIFATSRGSVRRNKLADFFNVRANGKIAMKLDDGESLVNVAIAREDQDVLLATKRGKAIRFPVADVRVFQSRASMGVRGINLSPSDKLISMTIVNHSDATTEERDSYLRYAAAMRRAQEEGVADFEPIGLSPDRLAELEAADQYLLTVAEDGLGKRSSLYEYRITARGGKGVELMGLDRGKERTEAIAAFPILEDDQLMVVSDGGQLIRTPVRDVRIAGRNTRGVWIFRVAEGEKIVSIARIEDDGADEDRFDGSDEGSSDEQPLG